jgi:heme-degrading monooxygenase HmoA
METEHHHVYVRVWEYDVAEDQAADFERIYGPDGDWAMLFRHSPGFLGTELFERVTEPGRYLTVDRFADEAAWRRFATDHAAAYAELDQRTQSLAVAERQLAATESG